jgi:tetratricopeptide (TPR) repeat protein
MALANIAEMLCRRGNRVVMVDCDLESPALEHYFPLVTTRARAEKGLLDLIRDFKAVLSNPPEEHDGEKVKLPLPQIEQYLLHIHADNEERPLWLLPPGLRAGGVNYARYTEEVRLFDWDDFYRNWEGELFFEWLRRQLITPDSGDVVLINGGPGISEPGNTCMRLLADAVVMFCTASTQSIEGTFEMASELAIGRWARPGRSPAPLLVVPSRVDRAEAELLQNFRRRFAERFGSYCPKRAPDGADFFWNMAVPYVPYYSFREEVAVREAGAGHADELVAAYARIADAMTLVAPPGIRSSAADAAASVATAPVITQSDLSLPETQDKPPYRGLEPFYQEHADLFYGRQRYVAKLRDMIREPGLVVIKGQSGSGKSSLVYAGLLPQLSAGALPGSEEWPLAVFKPGSDPFNALAGALLPLLQSQTGEPPIGMRTLAERLANEDGALAAVIEQMLKGRPEASRLLMIIDQFEELYTVSQIGVVRLNFQRQLLNALRGGRLSAILTMRADFIDSNLMYGPLVEAFEGRLLELELMTRAEYVEAIVMPARKAGLEFEPGLVERILTDVGQEPGNLPLLQFALAELWTRKQGGRLTHSAYDEIGGVQGAVTSRAEQTYAALSAPRRGIARKIFMQLVHVGEGEGAKNTRRRATFDAMGEPADEVRKIVKSLVAARLLVCSTGLGPRGGAPIEYVEVAHEALIQGWGKLKGWVEEERRFLIWRQHLRQRMLESQRAGGARNALRRLLPLQDSGALLSGFPLRAALWWMKQRGGYLSSAEKRYIMEGVRQRRFRLAAVVAVIIATALIFAFVYKKQTRQTERIEGVASVFYQRGEEARREGKTQEAVANFTNAFTVDPFYADAYLRCAEIWADQGKEDRRKYDDAVQSYEKYLDLKPEDAAAFVALGVVYFERNGDGDADRARSSFDRALVLNPALPSALYRRALLSEREGKAVSATDDYTNAIAADPDLYQALVGRGRILYKHWKEGRSPFNPIDGDGQSEYKRALADYEQARIIVERLSQKGTRPDFDIPFYELGVFYEEAGDRSTDAEKRRGDDKKNYRQAVENYERAVELNPKSAEAFNNLGRVRFALSDTKGALQALEEAITLRRDYVAAYNNLGAVYQQEKEYGKAVKNYLAALEREPDNVASLVGLGQAYEAQGTHDEALSRYSRALELTNERDQSDIYFLLGVAYFNKKDGRSARDSFLKTRGNQARWAEAKSYLERLDYDSPPSEAVVSIHFDGVIYDKLSGDGTVEAIKAGLDEAGFKRVNQVVADTAPLARVSVRRYHKQDKKNAERVEGIVRGILAPKNIEVEAKPYYNRLLAKESNFGLIEIYITSPPSSPEPSPFPTP